MRFVVLDYAGAWRDHRRFEGQRQSRGDAIFCTSIVRPKASCVPVFLGHDMMLNEECTEYMGQVNADRRGCHNGRQDKACLDVTSEDGCM